MKNLLIFSIVIFLFSLSACQNENGLKLSVSTDLEYTFVNDTIPLQIIITDHPFSQSLDLNWQIKKNCRCRSKEFKNPTFAYLLKNGSKIENSEHKTIIKKSDQFAFLTTSTGTYDISFTVENNDQSAASDNITLDIRPTKPSFDYVKKRVYPVFNILILGLFFIMIILVFAGLRSNNQNVKSNKK